MIKLVSVWVVCHGRLWIQNNLVSSLLVHLLLKGKLLMTQSSVAAHNLSLCVSVCVCVWFWSRQWSCPLCHVTCDTVECMQPIFNSCWIIINVINSIQWSYGMYLMRWDLGEGWGCMTHQSRVVCRRISYQGFSVFPVLFFLPSRILPEYSIN